MRYRIIPVPFLPNDRMAALTIGNWIFHNHKHGPMTFAMLQHEQVHVRQWKRWGPFFPFIYLYQWVKAGFNYRNIWFEREAYGDFDDH
jgi:hypothetical protein